MLFSPEVVPGAMRWRPHVWCVYWMSISRCGGARSRDPVRRSQDMIDQWFPSEASPLTAEAVVALGGRVGSRWWDGYLDSEWPA